MRSAPLKRAPVVHLHETIRALNVQFWRRPDLPKADNSQQSIIGLLLGPRCLLAAISVKPPSLELRLEGLSSAVLCRRTSSHGWLCFCFGKAQFRLAPVTAEAFICSLLSARFNKAADGLRGVDLVTFAPFVDFSSEFARTGQHLPKRPQ
jgi:hypothetical protein